jgi:tRNA pseudouridine55 synthase
MIVINIVLVLGIGSGTTKLTEYLSGTKKYSAIAKLGTSTDTLDSTGEVLQTTDCSHITIDTLQLSLNAFRGEISQVPPMYSALKKNGKRLSDLARSGEVVIREPRAVTVYQLELLPDRVKLPEFAFEVECSGGFYVRSLIDDIAKSCGGLAHMTHLCRIKQGPFVTSDCIHEDNWEFDKIIETIN